MNDTQVYIVNAFTDALFGGNPAAVVPVESAMSDELMQSIAAQHNLSETAFPECLGPDRFNLRWFTPQKKCLCADTRRWQRLMHSTIEVIGRARR